MKDLLTISADVKDALNNNRPVIALESTLIAHGFPYPENLELALEMKQYLKNNGVTPATIAILNGRIKVGLSQDELEYVASSENIHKTSLRDIPVLIAKKLDGGTTVAGTMQIASLAGIKVFVTGGIGGVHHQGEKTFDISADLKALSQYNVIVISAGAKSVLDLPKTREKLESLGVPVLGYKSNQFPAFYLRNSGLSVDYKVDTPEEVVRTMQAREELKSSGGILVTTPIPEEDELNPESFTQILEDALKEVEEKEIKGKAVTPYLLMKLKDKTGGESVKANIALIKNNLRVGIAIASVYYKGDEN